jgi:hypothetical protein
MVRILAYDRDNHDHRRQRFYDRRLASARDRTPGRDRVLCATAGVLMGWFYSFVARARGTLDARARVLEPGKQPFHGKPWLPMGHR